MSFGLFVGIVVGGLCGVTLILAFWFLAALSGPHEAGHRAGKQPSWPHQKGQKEGSDMESDTERGWEWLDPNCCSNGTYPPYDYAVLSKSALVL